jgi:hypothetical protein
MQKQEVTFWQSHHPYQALICIYEQVQQIKSSLSLDGAS